MDYSQLIHELRQASLFDLYRLRVAIDNLLDQPERLRQIAARLHPGMTITYFNGSQNRLVEATVEAIQRTNIHIRDNADGKRWRLPLYMVNLEGINPDIHAARDQQGLDKNRLKVGETVGYRSRQNQEVYGTVLQLNPKTATVLTSTGERWRVPYALLFKVMEGGANNEYQEAEYTLEHFPTPR